VPADPAGTGGFQDWRLRRPEGRALPPHGQFCGAVRGPACLLEAGASYPRGTESPSRRASRLGQAGQSVAMPRRKLAFSSGRETLMNMPEPISKPASRVSRGMTLTYQW
jgi:hypothetical protein